MQFDKNKIMTAIAICLLISTTASFALIPNATAHTPPWTIPTHAYIQAEPNPVGVGQPVVVYMWIDKIPDGATMANERRWHDYKLVITDPDGKETTKTWDVVQDTTSSQYYRFTPDKAGTYSFNFSFPGQVFTWTDVSASTGLQSNYINDTYLASSATATLTVQEEPLSTFPDSYPLPTEYWTRPIYGENPYWWTISSNWLGVGSPGYTGLTLMGSQNAYPLDSIGSQTSHIMWTKPLQSGGVVGGDNFEIKGDTYFEGSAYNQRFTNPIIVNGRLYYTESLSFSGNSVGPTDCVDLRTGELIWSRNDVPALSFAYIYDVQDPNQHGVYPAILFTSSWRAFDADTGKEMFNVTNVPSGISVKGSQGEVLIYTVTNCGTSANPQYYLAQWNSSNLWTGQYSGASTSPAVIPPITNGADPRMYDWNISVPALNTLTSAPSQFVAIFNNMLICCSSPVFQGALTTYPYTYFAINLNSSKGAVGSLLWKNTLDQPTGNITVCPWTADPTANSGSGVFVEYHKEKLTWVGYSMATGQRLWESEPQLDLDYYSTPAAGWDPDIAMYGRLYSSGFSGTVYCYDLATGKILWTYGNGGAGNSTNSGLEVPGHYPTSINAIGNGIVYTVSVEHTVNTPIYKNALARAINATDGTEIWTLSAYTGEFMLTSYAMADGYNTFFNGYDNQIYTVGRGPSKTTVSAPSLAASLGQGVYISGTVTDISSGTTQHEQAARFPNGVPVASDSSMTDWMGYVYQQKPKPTNFTGVEVTISVLDANNNYRTIGTATTDASGYYSIAWTPDIAGKYTVYATFAGTKGYWGSSAETGFTVDEPVATATPQPTQPPSAADLYFIPAIAGLFVFVAIIGVVIILVLRKHP